MQFRHYLSLLIILSLQVAGCQSVTTAVHKPFSKLPGKESTTSITEMICLWEQAEGIGLDKQPTRGFAGQLMFFGANKNEPVAINGDVQIYIFDDLGDSQDQSKPIHTFSFEKETFEAFRTQTNLGTAYQLFVPYTRKLPYKATCAIRVKVSSDQGQAQPVYSKMASVILPGPESPQALARKKTLNSGIQQASYETTSKQPVREVTPEEASAYFGSTSLPKPKVEVATSNDLQRLRSAMTQVVAEDREAPVSRPEMASRQTRFPAGQSRHPVEESVDHAPAAVAPQRHPLLDD